MDPYLDKMFYCPINGTAGYQLCVVAARYPAGWYRCMTEKNAVFFLPEETLAKLGPQGPGYFKVEEISETAQKMLDQLKVQRNQGDPQQN